MFADLCPCFHQLPTRPNFGRSRIKVCPILCRLRTKLCPNFGCSGARLCPISFAPCPFPNLAGTLNMHKVCARDAPRGYEVNVFYAPCLCEAERETPRLLWTGSSSSSQSPPPSPAANAITYDPHAIYIMIFIIFQISLVRSFILVPSTRVVYLTIIICTSLKYIAGRFSHN